MLKFLQGNDDLSDEMRDCRFRVYLVWAFFVIVFLGAFAANISYGIMDSLQSQHAICESRSTTQENNK